MPPPPLAPGVLGIVIDYEGALWIPVIMADPETEGAGHVGRYLDSLAHRHVVVPNVMNPKLEGMLNRRGFHVETIYSWEFKETVRCHVRQAKPDARDR